MRQHLAVFCAYLLALPCSCHENRKSKPSRGSRPRAEQRARHPARNARRPAKTPTPRSLARMARGQPSPKAQEVLEALKALRTCKLTSMGIEFACPARQRFMKLARRLSSEVRAQLRDEAIPLLKDPSPAVRYEAVRTIWSLRFCDASEERHRKILLEHARHEQNRDVLSLLFHELAQCAGKDDAIRSFLYEMAKHKDPKVRDAALSSLMWAGTKVPGLVDEIAKLVAKEQDPTVLRGVCAGNFRLRDLRLLPIYEKLTTTPTRNPDVFWSCVEAIMRYWIGYSTPSREAFELTLDRIRKGLDAGLRPPVLVVGRLHEKPKVQSGPSGGKVPDWYREDQVAQILARMAKLKKTPIVVNMVAVASLGKLGAVDKLKELKEFFESGAGKSYRHAQDISKAIDKWLAKAGQK